MLLLAEIRQHLAAMPPPDPRQLGTPAENVQQEEKRRQLLELLAEIERRVNEENARPKKRYISPATREAVYATYVDAVRRRIEARGTENFPEVGGRKLYGQLTMMVAINFDGSLVGTDIVVASGNPQLDRQAQAIVRSIGNFGKFTDAMRRQTDQILLPSRFRFTRDETLETQASSATRVGGAMDLYCVMGNPVEHSRSPWIHARFAELTGQSLDYGRRLVAPGGFAPAVAAFRADPAGTARGCNVTVPFKFEAFRLARHTSERASAGRGGQRAELPRRRHPRRQQRRHRPGA